jgi:hypothetical protein
VSTFYQEGRYKGEVVNQALGKNQRTSTPQFVLRFRVMCMIDGDRDVSVRQQYERTVYMYLSEKSAPFTIKKLQEAGFSGSSIRQLDLSHPEAQSFVGQYMEFQCVHEEGKDGEIREKWDLAYKSGNGDIEITPLEPAEARKLDALFGATLKITPAAAPKTAPARPVTTTDPISNDDIPF